MIGEKQKLKDVCVRITKGTTPSTYGFPFVESGINYVKAESILEGGGILPTTFAFIDELTHEYLKRSILCDKDILISIAGAKLGKCGFLTEQYLPANTNQAVGIVRVDQNNADPKFVYYNFVNGHTYQVINSLNSQAAQPNLNLGQLGELEFRFPPLPTQRKIASILSAYDDLIENNLKRIKLLEKKAFLKYKGIVRSEKLKRIRLGDVATVNYASLKANSNIDKILYVDIASVSTGSIDSKTQYDIKDAPGRAKRIVKHEDIIWSCVRPNRKSYSFVWRPEENLIASTGFAVISAEKIPSTFLFQAITASEFVNYLENHAKGATYPAVTASDFEEAFINIPSKVLMEEYHKEVYPCFELKNILQKQNTKLREARDILLPKLMNGQIEV
jgi:type I restriction enzyme S subunit